MSFQVMVWFTNLTTPLQLQAEGINNTPLTPYLDQELLYNNSLSIDGSKIEGTGFRYDNPAVTDELLREQVAYFVEQGLFPGSVLE